MKKIVIIFCTVLVIVLLGIGIGGGISVANTQDTIKLLESTENALATTVLDRNGRLISQFFAEERREPIELKDMPPHLIHALLTREDQTFFKHRGFSFQGTMRAVWNLVTNNYVSGGSTLSQQLAGYFFADRSEFSISRKLKELWWALQLERHWTKNQIIEKYLNTMFFGHGNYGVESASKFYFNRSAKDLTVAESVLLVIQLANPSRYSPIRRPNEARTIQRTILEQMVDLGYITAAEAQDSFAAFWDEYDYTRANDSAAFFERYDNAPYFTEYVRFLLENEYLLGSADINRDGYTVHTTLDLDYQEYADTYLRAGIQKANRIYRSNDSTSYNESQSVIAMTELLALTFDMGGFKDEGSSARRRALVYYQNNLVDLIDMSALLFTNGNSEFMRQISRQSQQILTAAEERTVVEGALIAIENGSGHVLAMVGGSKFESRNQFNRAISSRVEPGSAFKPLYYSSAIENKAITPATLIYDSPIIFWNDDGTPYIPQNYRGVWQGPVLARTALARSMNVPSLRVLERVGFSDALETARLLLGIEQNEMIERNLVRRYPVGLGVVEVSPLEMVQAYSVFANQGKRIAPLAIRYIEDRDGKIVLEVEKEQFKQQAQNPEIILSEQTAYIMTDMLQSTTSIGTLRYAVQNAGGFKGIDIGGKTGTTQNWADAWTVGFTPYVTAAVWLGFDRGGFNSLGTNQTGAVTAGPIWAQFMRDVHANLPPRKFVAPSSGITTQEVTASTGLLPPTGYSGRVLNEIFLIGTAPTQYDTLSQFQSSQNQRIEARLYNRLQNRSTTNTPLNSRNQFGILGNDNSNVLDENNVENNSTPDESSDINLELPAISEELLN